MAKSIVLGVGQFADMAHFYLTHDSPHDVTAFTVDSEYLKDKVTIGPALVEGLVEIAFDPQTSGGLLIALPQRHASKLIEDLHSNGVEQATTIGHAVSLQKAWVRLA